MTRLKKAREAKQKRSNTAKGKRVEVRDDDEDELSMSPQSLTRIQRTSSRTLLKSMEEAFDAVKQLFERGELANGNIVEILEGTCTEIMRMLSAAKGEPERDARMNSFSNVSSQNKYFVYRGRSSEVYILRPVLRFKGTSNYNRKKVVGFIQNPDDCTPLMCAFPGWKKCTEDHPLLLDADTWLPELKLWADNHDFQFKKYVFDIRHGQEPGHTYRSHVEPRLMVWFACQMVRRYLGVDKSIRAQIGNIWRLKDLDERLEAELVLTRDPCPPCLAFIENFGAYSGITFHVTRSTSLGEVILQKNAHNQRGVGLYAIGSEEENEQGGSGIRILGSDSDSGSDDTDVQVRETTKTISRLEVRIPPHALHSTSQSHVTHTAPSHYVSNNVSSSSTASILTKKTTKTKTKTISTKKLLQGFSYGGEETLRRPVKRHYFSDDEDKEYKPAVSYAKSKTSAPKTPRKGSHTNGVLTPDSSPFSSEAIERAQQIRRKKAKNPRNESPSESQNPQHIHF